MIQRIQSLYLLIAAVLCFILPWSLFFTGTMTGSHNLLNYMVSEYTVSSADGALMKQEFNMAETILAFVAGGMSLVIIFLYKHRNKQIQAIQITIAVWAALAVYIAFLSYISFHGQELAERSFKMIAVIIPVNVILWIMAVAGIRKDIALLRSADRIR